jgi:hypothetical protein
MKNFTYKGCRTLLQGFVFFSMIILATGCKKIGPDYDVYFYSDVESSGTPLTLFLDGDLKGELPNLHTTIRFDNDTIKSGALHLKLKGGKYKMEAKDKNGETRSAGTIKFHQNSGGGSCTKGGNGQAGSGRTVVVKVFF